MPLMARTFSFVVLAVALCSGQRPPQLIDDPSQVACRVQQLEYAPAPVQAEAWRLPPIEIRCTVPVPTAPPKGGLTYLNRISADIAIEYEGGFKNEPFDCGSTADDVVDAVLFVNSNPGLPSASPSVAKGQDQMAPTPQLGEIDGDRLVFPDVFIPVPGAPVDPENPPAQCAEGEPSPSNPGACFPPETVLRIFNVQLDPEPNIRLKVTVFPEGSTATEERIQIPQVSPDILRITAGSAAAEDIGEQRAVSGAIEVEIRGAKFWMFDAQCGDELSEPQPQRVVVEPSRFWFFTGDLSHLDYRMTVVDTVRGSDGSEWRLSQGHNEDGSGGEPVETDGQTQVEPDENGNGLTMYRRFVVPEDLRDTTPRTEVRIVIPFAITYTPGPLADPPEFRLTVTPADSRPPEITVPKYEPPFARTAEPPGSTKTGSAKTHNANMSLPPFACAKLGLEVQQALTQPAIPSLIEGPMRPCDVRLFANGVVNAASFAPPEVSHGKLSPGSIITLFGQGLGSTEGVELAFPLSAEVNGIRVRVRNGNETVDALPLFSNGAQINAVLTNATPRGPVTIWAEVDGEMSNEVPVEVVDAAVGLFAIEGSYGIVQKADAEFSLVTPDNPVHPGDILIAWGTGAGQTATPSELPPEAEDLGGVRVFLGDVEASRVLYAGPSPCCSGIHQFVFEASQETPGGSYVPLIVETDNGGVSNAVLLDVDDGSVDELNPRKPLAGERLNKGEIRLRSRLRPQPSGAIEAREIIEARSERDRRFDFTPQIDPPPPRDMLVRQPLRQ